MQSPSWRHTRWLESRSWWWLVKYPLISYPCMLGRYLFFHSSVFPALCHAFRARRLLQYFQPAFCDFTVSCGCPDSGRVLNRQKMLQQTDAIVWHMWPSHETGPTQQAAALPPRWTVWHWFITPSSPGMCHCPCIKSCSLSSLHISLTLTLLRTEPNSNSTWLCLTASWWETITLHRHQGEPLCQVWLDLRRFHRNVCLQAGQRCCCLFVVACTWDLNWLFLSCLHISQCFYYSVACWTLYFCSDHNTEIILALL